MKKLIFLTIITTIVWSCNKSGNGITGTWKYENGDNSSQITFKEDGSYLYEQLYIANTENYDIDSGNYKVLEGDVYEFTPINRRHNGKKVTVSATDQYQITPNGDGTLLLIPGRLYVRDKGTGTELKDGTFHTVITQGEYNNAFSKYVFTNDSLFRYQGYSQTSELADSLYKPYMYTGIRLDKDKFTTVRIAPDGKEYTEDFRYNFIGDKLFFGKEKEQKEFRKI
jgi:hypothetical protein